MADTEALLFGRRTWAGMAAVWPTLAGDPFADRMNEIPEYVASRTLGRDDLSWPGSMLLPPDDAIGAIRELRARDGRARALELVSATTTGTGVLICTYRRR
ncbi:MULTISPECIES: hypothetical protein [unclassified Mycobacterium]|uniref:hypothetical protein n=1 Tax=unclassified Mycobacterium TaxID=2642494 RepID=UPI0018D4A48E|nr:MULTISPECIES: hypothetical protein [unclassified Mycobacterium]